MRKKISIYIFLFMIIFIVGCGKNEDSIENIVEVEKDLEIEEDSKEVEKETKLRGVRLGEKIVAENFKDVQLEDYVINTDINDDRLINNAEFFFFIDEEDKDKAEELAEKYGQIFYEKFKEVEDIMAMTLYWASPNITRKEPIERDYI